jgi:photosystem II stability/assembly factor-like uncharacterized protein
MWRRVATALIAAFGLGLGLGPVGAAAAGWHRTDLPPGLDLYALAAETDGTLVGVGFDNSIALSRPGAPAFQRLRPGGVPTDVRVESLMPVAGGLRMKAGSELYGSPDHGSSWVRLGTIGRLGSSRDVVAWALDVAQPHRLVRVGPDGTVQRSLNGGRTWLSAAPLQVPDEYLPSASATISGGDVFVAGGGRLWRSDDLADTWVALPTPPEGELAPVTPAGVLWITGVTSAGVHRSVDGGATWQRVFAGVGRLEPSPVEPAIAWIVERKRIRLTTDGGATWVDRGEIPDLQPGAAVHAFAAFRNEPRSACLVRDAVAWCSHAGEPFAPDMNRTVGATPTGAGFSGFVPDPHVLGAGMALVGALVWETLDSGATWRPATAPGAYGSIAILRRGALLADDRGVVWRGRGMTRWIRRSGPTGSTTFVVDPATEVVYATSRGVLWRAVGGRSFQRVRTRGLPRAATVAGVGGRGHTVIAVVGRRFLISTDAGRTFRRLAPGATYVAVADPQVRSRVVAVSGRGLLRSVDGGRTWKRVTRQTPLAVVADPFRHGRWYSEFRGVVRVSGDGARTWRALTAARPDAPILTVLAVSPGRLWRFAPAFWIFPGLPNLYWRSIPR